MSSPWTEARARLARDPGARAAAAVLAGVLAASLVLPWLGGLLGLDPLAVDLEHTLLPPLSGRHLLGTDELGRDVLVRLAVGGRSSLLVGLAVAVAAALLGTLAGVGAAMAGGLVDALAMRGLDALLSLPVLPLLMVVAALGPRGSGTGLAGLVLLLCALGWMGTARLARAATLQARALDHVLAARALGASPLRIVGHHVLPFALPPVLVATTLEVGSVVLLEAALSFLGLGIRPPLPSWGNMLTHAQDYLWRAPLLAVWPGLCILATVAAVNALGDALRRALDPAAIPGVD